MVWCYAELSRMAKTSGGPDKLLTGLFEEGFRHGRRLVAKSDTKKAITWTISGIIAGGVLVAVAPKAKKFFSSKKATVNTKAGLVKRQLIQKNEVCDVSQITASCNDVVGADESVETIGDMALEHIRIPSWLLNSRAFSEATQV